MRTFKLTLEYDGSKYSGWQTQINARSVQGELQSAADELFGVDVDVQGAGRTDAGEHAMGQVAHLKVRTLHRELSPPRILRELNDRLPSSIAVLECVEAPPRFHARHDAVSRTYFYQISTRQAPLSKRFVWGIKQPLCALRESRVSTSPTVQHVGHPRKLTKAPTSGAKVHQPSLDEYSTATVSNPKPTSPRKTCSIVFRLCNISPSPRSDSTSWPQCCDRSADLGSPFGKCLSPRAPSERNRFCLSVRSCSSCS